MSGRTQSSRLKHVGVRVGMAAALLFGLFIGVMALGVSFSIYRFIDSVNFNDPTTGRAHFWSVTLDP